jgi:hypothetical protein
LSETTVQTGTDGISISINGGAVVPPRFFGHLPRRAHSERRATVRAAGARAWARAAERP